MRDGLPPLEALRAFEAAARHLSFTRAAEELFVTQSAVSKQVIALESALATRLFERKTRALALTAAGELWLTRHADAGDYILGAGCSLHLSRDDRAVVQALQTSRVRLIPA